MLAWVAFVLAGTFNFCELFLKQNIFLRKRNLKLVMN